jgi:glucose uptake protein GlcU
MDAADRALTSSQTQTGTPVPTALSLHGLGVLCGIGAGVWLGAAEAPTKLVNSGLSPFAISLCMVAGVFTARWTIPTLLKGTHYVFSDLAQRKHLIVWALLAGALWAVANTLTVFAIRDVGLAIAFPLWNANSLIGLFWGWLLFRELRGASGTTVAKVVIGAVAIVAAAILLGFSTIRGGIVAPHNAIHGIMAAAGASLLWGTMYVPYRKAYISGMNPLSFVTAFTVGELGTMLALVLALDGGIHSPVFHSGQVTPMLFWLFLGGFVWVIGDLFQQFAVKHLGIGRGIPLSNTNQLWGLAWGALVFGELSHVPITQKLFVVGGSIVMILGALLVSSAVAGEGERSSMNEAVMEQCERYHMEYEQVLAGYHRGEAEQNDKRHGWWDYLIVVLAVAIFVWLGSNAAIPPLAINFPWLAVLVAILLLTLGGCCWALWKKTGFS